MRQKVVCPGATPAGQGKVAVPHASVRISSKGLERIGKDGLMRVPKCTSTLEVSVRRNEESPEMVLKCDTNLRDREIRAGQRTLGTPVRLSISHVLSLLFRTLGREHEENPS
jgi:hypothetical protein